MDTPPTDVTPATGGQNCNFCPTHHLNLLQLSALYAVSQVFNRTQDTADMLRELLRVLHDEAGLTHGLIGVVEPDTGYLAVHSLYHPDQAATDSVRYQPGEGILGLLLEKPRTVMLKRVADEPRFLHRLGVYLPELPFIAVPIKAGNAVCGVLAVQPENEDDGLLSDRGQFVEMVANLIGKSV